MMKSAATFFALAMMLIIAAGCEKEQGKSDGGHEPCPSNFVVQPDEASKLDGSTASAPAAAGKVTRLVLITTTQACECTMARCKKTEAALDKGLKEMTGLPSLETINMATEPDKAREIAMKHQASMLPVVLLLDEKDGLIVKLEGEFTEEDLIKALAAHANDKAAAAEVKPAQTKEPEVKDSKTE